MKTHEAEAILKYCADIPRRLTIIRRQCATLDDEVDTLKGINMAAGCPVTAPRQWPAKWMNWASVTG